MSASPLEELQAKVARLETESAEKDKRLRDLGKRVFALETGAAEAAIERSHLETVTANLVLAVWALYQDGTLAGPSAVRAELAVKNAARMLNIPLAA